MGRMLRLLKPRHSVFFGLFVTSVITNIPSELASYSAILPLTSQFNLKMILKLFVSGRKNYVVLL